MQIADISRDTLQSVIRLCELEGWESYCENVERTWRAFTAPGIITVVVVDGNETLGFASLMTDGEIQSYLILIAVTESHRGQEIGTRLIEEVFARAGAKRIDLLSTEGADDFFRSFTHQTWPGFRIFPLLSPDPQKD